MRVFTDQVVKLFLSFFVYHLKCFYISEYLVLEHIYRAKRLHKKGVTLHIWPMELFLRKVMSLRKNMFFF